MAQIPWSAPPTPMSNVAGAAVTAAALTAGTPQPPYVIPGGTLDYGSKLILEADLEVTSTSVTPTLTVGFYIGAVGGAIGSAVLLAATQALPIAATETAWPVTVRWKGTIRTLSATAGVIQGSGESLNPTSLTAWTSAPFPATAAARTVSTLNTSQNNQLDVGITLSSTTGTPSVTCTGFYARVDG
jgi:hypothetical protein